MSKAPPVAALTSPAIAATARRLGETTTGSVVALELNLEISLRGSYVERFRLTSSSTSSTTDWMVSRPTPRGRDATVTL